MEEIVSAVLSGQNEIVFTLMPGLTWPENIIETIEKMHFYRFINDISIKGQAMTVHHSHKNGRRAEKDLVHPLMPRLRKLFV